MRTTLSLIALLAGLLNAMSQGNNADLPGEGYEKPANTDFVDVWEERASGAPPAGRDAHTAVWTGTEMIVWGGYGPHGVLGDGSRFNPALNIWRGVRTKGAPAARGYHLAVWTGSEMFICGGTAPGGGRYNPVNDTWAAVACGDYSTAVWKGQEIIF